MDGVNPGVKAGFSGGVIYGFIVFIFVVLSLTVIIPFSRLSKLISSTTGILIPDSVLMILTIIGAIVILVITIILGILFGLLYSWIYERVEYEWGILIALIIGGLFGLFLGFIINLPLARMTILTATLTLSPTYSFTLYLTHRKATMKFNASWIAELDDIGKEVLLAIGTSGCRYWDLKEKINIEDENLRVKLQELELKEYIDIKFDNRYVPTEKGKIVLKKLLRTTSS